MAIEYVVAEEVAIFKQRIPIFQLISRLTKAIQF